MNNAEILTYHNGPELSQIINSMKARFAGREEAARFVIPSRKDKIWKPELDSIKYIWTWEELYEDICKSGNVNRKRILSPPDHMLILKAILNDVLSEHADKASQWPGLSRAGFPDVLSGDIRELLNEAVRPSQMINDPNSNEPSEFMLPEVYKRYLDYLESNNLLDSARIWTEAYEEMLKNLEWGKNLSIVFVGFLSFTHGQLDLLYALQDRCRELIIIQPEANLANFRDSRAQFFMTPDSKKSSGNIIELPIYEPGLEPEVIARTLALWQQGKWSRVKGFPGFDSIGIMTAPGREDLFAQAFRRYGVPYNFQSGIRINLTLPGKILASIRHLNARQFPSYETALLLTQECFAGLNFPVMRAYRASASGLDGWTEYLSRLDDSDSQTFRTALLAVQSIQRFCDALKLKKTPAGIMRAFHEFITTPGLWLDRMDKASELPELDETTRITASAIQTIGEKVLRLEELMPDLGPIQDRKINNDEAFDYLESWCRETNTRAPLQISNSVRIFTGQPPVLCSLPVWIMTGVTQKTWSANITSSPLLGNEERAKLSENDAHLPTTLEKAVQREALFRRLIHTGEKLTIISRPELDEEDRPISESPFMPRFREDLPDWKIIHSKPAGISILLGRDNFIFPEVDSQREKIERKKPVLKSGLSGVGASDIKTLLSCPFLWFQNSQAKLYEPDSDIISPIEWGNMIHKLWECVWIRYRLDMNSSGKIFLSIVNDEWQKLLQSDKFDESGDYGKYYKLVKDFRLARHLEGVKFRVNRLAMTQAAILDKLHGAGYEHSRILLEEDAHLKAEINNITFLGQCDRIELLRSPNGENIAFIADYKEGQAINSESGLKNIESSSWNSDGRKNFKFGLQLSCYAALFNKCHENITLSGVYILGLEDGKLAGTFTPDELDYFAEYLDDKNKKKAVIDDRVSEGNYAMQCASVILNSGEFEPEYESDSCRWCHVKSLCRKGEFKGESLISDNDDSDDDNNDDT